MCCPHEHGRNGAPAMAEDRVVLATFKGAAHRFAVACGHP
jgi:hypothetical protein